MTRKSEQKLFLKIQNFSREIFEFFEFFGSQNEAEKLQKLVYLAKIKF